MLGAEYTIGVVILLAVLAGVISWGVVQIIRGAVKKYRATKGKRKGPWWWNTVLRVLAVSIGALAGWMLDAGTWGAIIGACGGILNTTMVAFIKGKFKTASEDPSLDIDLGSNRDVEDDPEREGMGR